MQTERRTNEHAVLPNNTKTFIMVTDDTDGYTEYFTMALNSL